MMYMHYEGHGEAVKLATALRQALSASGTPLGASGAPLGASGAPLGGGNPSAPSATGPALDAKQIEQAAVIGKMDRAAGDL